jgi:hypothetical protein
MRILNPIETLMEIKELCENNEEQLGDSVDIELEGEHDRLITIILDLCEDTLKDTANELSGMVKK